MGKSHSHPCTHPKSAQRTLAPAVWCVKCGTPLNFVCLPGETGQEAIQRIITAHQRALYEAAHPKDPLDDANSHEWPGGDQESHEAAFAQEGIPTVGETADVQGAGEQLTGSDGGQEPALG